MTQDFKKQLTWFTKRSLQIRLIEIEGFSLPYSLSLEEIESKKDPNKNGELLFSSEEKPGEHLKKMVTEIRGFYLKNSKHHASREDIDLKCPDDKLFCEVIGIDSDLLRFFMVEHLKIQTSLLSIGEGGSLLYVDLPTLIILSATEQTILARLRDKKEQEEVLAYGDIFEIITTHKGTKKDAYVKNNATQEQKDTAARKAISDLLKRIKSSELFKDIEKDKIINNISGEGYILMM